MDPKSNCLQLKAKRALVRVFSGTHNKGLNREVPCGARQDTLACLRYMTGQVRAAADDDEQWQIYRSNNTITAAIKAAEKLFPGHQTQTGAHLVFDDLVIISDLCFFFNHLVLKTLKSKELRDWDVKLLQLFSCKPVDVWAKVAII